MALSAEQQAQVDMQNAIDQPRRTHELAMEARRAKLEAIRLAKETLIENNRNKPVDSREISAADVTAFATTLVNYVNS